MPKSKQAYVDYQRRAKEFQVGDIVFSFFLGNDNQSGRVQAVWPAIGMVDVEFPTGSIRMPVEDLQRYEAKDYMPPEVGDENIPGGLGTVGVPGGPDKLPHTSSDHSSRDRVARAFVKKALYWASADRQYKATKAELDGGSYMCPKCKQEALRKAIYKRRSGQSVPLLGCGNCLFLIKREDILGDPSYVEFQPDPELLEAL